MSGKELIINPGWCKGCGICVAFCPKGALELTGEGTVRPVPGRECILCGECERRCPDYAVYISDAETEGDG